MKLLKLFCCRFGLLGLAVFFLVSACSPVSTPIESASTAESASATPSPTSTIVWFPATSTPTKIPTTASEPTLLVHPSHGDLILDDQFKNESAWVVGSYAAGNVDFGTQLISLAVSQPGGFLSSFRKDTYQTDFYLEVTTQSSLCSAGDEFGIGFWAINDLSFHRLALTCDGLMRLEKVKDKKITPLSDWIASSQIPRGPQLPIRVGLWVGGRTIRVYLNGQLQAELQSATGGTGGIGVFAASNGQTAVTVSFSDLQIFGVSPDQYIPTATPTIRPTKTALPTIPTP